MWAYVHCTLCSNKGSRFYVLFELQLKVYGCFFATVKIYESRSLIQGVFFSLVPPLKSSKYKKVNLG